MSTVKLEVGAWYWHNGLEKYALADQICDGGCNLLHWINEGVRTHFAMTDLMSGPYHIEPGDRVRPKPAGDKCWDGLARYFVDDVLPKCAEHIVSEVKELTWSTGKQPTAYGGYHQLPLSCLILLEKSAKAPAQDFQVGDGPTASQKLNEFLEHVRAKNNPRVLPSVSGSELLWPDVRPGIDLDKLPEDKTTIEDRDANAWSTQTVSTAKAVLNFLCSVETNIRKTNNSDRERIRKIIPEIERKLTKLKGRVQG